MPELKIERDGAIGRVVFSNPEKFNAMSQSMWAALPGALQDFDADPAIRIVVLQGAGDRAFVSGADISQFESQRTNADAQRDYNAIVEAAYQAPIRCSKPVVARIRGVCMGGGLGLAAACDVRFCTQGSRFRMSAGRLGLGYNVPGVRRFLQVLGLQNTLDIFFSARMFDALEALRMGFVTRVEPESTFDAAIDAWCREVAVNAPLTLRALKQTVNSLLRDPHERDMAAVEASIAACFASEDYREGARAFMEKRQPAFKGA